MKKTEVDKKIEKIKKSGYKTSLNTAIQNNYYHYNIQISPQELSVLAGKDAESARMYLKLQQQQLEHAKEIDSRILSLEEREQEARHAEQPYIRKFFARGQLFAFGTIMLGCVSAVCFGYFGMELPAVFSLSITGGTVVAQFLGTGAKRKE